LPKLEGKKRKKRKEKAAALASEEEGSRYAGRRGERVKREQKWSK